MLSDVPNHDLYLFRDSLPYNTCIDISDAERGIACSLTACRKPLEKEAEAKGGPPVRQSASPQGVFNTLHKFPVIGLSCHREPSLAQSAARGEGFAQP